MAFMKSLVHPSQLARNVYNGIVFTLIGIKHLSIWIYREFFYWFHLFMYTSCRSLRVEAFLALGGAFAYFSTVMIQEQTLIYRTLIEHCYLYFSIVMVLLSMNLLPRERDEETLEILWSQPMSRSGLILLQLFTLTFWTFLLACCTIGFFSYFSAYSEDPMYMLILLFTTLFAVGSLTVLVSTFCRHGLATGMVSLLILGVHYFWLPAIGPIEFFFNPIPPPEAERGLDTFNFWFNRIILLVAVGFILDYLFRRLKRTAEWFT